MSALMFYHFLFFETLFLVWISGNASGVVDESF